MAVSRSLPAVIALAGVLAGCSSTGEHKPLIPLPWPHKPSAAHPKVDPDLPALPAAGSGRGGYYQDDGPGANPPPNLRDVPDAEVRYEPYAKFANRPYAVFGQVYTPLLTDEPFVQRGVASWYGVKFHGQRTSSGEPYDMYKMTAAHPVLPIPSYARVTSLETGKSVVVRINDRGPFHSSRIIDVSYTAALKLGLLGKGSHEVEVERLFPNDESRLAANRRAATSRAQSAPSDIAALMLEDRVPAGEVAPVARATLAPARSVAPAAAPAPAPAQAGGAGFYLQLGAFSMAAKAREMSERLVAAGLAPESLEVVSAGALNRLFRGPYATRELALAAARELPAALGIKPIVVRR